RSTARRLAGEYALCVVTWAAILSAVAYFGVWESFLVGYFAPSLIAGNMQTLRQYTEHMGLLGHDVPSTTRTVIDPSWAGRVLSASMLHIDLHGPHPGRVRAWVPEPSCRALLPPLPGAERRSPTTAPATPARRPPGWRRRGC